MLQAISSADKSLWTANNRRDSSFLAGKALSPREQEVWALMAAGRSDTQIADALALNSLTVRFHLANVLAKLGALSLQEAALLAGRSDWLTTGPLAADSVLAEETR